MPTVGSFLPSTHGLHFGNYWPAGTPDLVVSTPLGNITIGDANNGLCGGFCFTANDLYQAGRQPPPDVSAPAGGSPLVTYLTWRLLASWNIPSGILTYYYWANTPDHDTLFGIRHGIARMTIEDQIPQITRSIDSGALCTLGLVTVYTADPTQLGKCHQVLAYGYDWNGSYFRLRVYDPNSSGNDGIYIGLDTSNPTHTTAVDNNVNISFPIRGFFFVPYTFNDPATIAGPPWKVKEKDTKEKEKDKEKEKETKEKEKDKDHKDGKDVMKEKEKDTAKEKDRDASNLTTSSAQSAQEMLSGWPLAGMDDPSPQTGGS
jgi:hypothetical protein